MFLGWLHLFLNLVKSNYRNRKHPRGDVHGGSIINLVSMCGRILVSECSFCTRVNGNPTLVIRFMQFHYCTVSNPGTRADNAFVLKRSV